MFQLTFFVPEFLSDRYHFQVKVIYDKIINGYIPDRYSL